MKVQLLSSCEMCNFVKFGVRYEGEEGILRLEIHTLMCPLLQSREVSKEEIPSDCPLPDWKEKKK